MNSKDKQILVKLLAEIAIMNKLTDGHDLTSFENDEKTKRAVCMTLINIGELVKLLSSDFRQMNPEIPWKAIAGLRDVTAHRYQTLKIGDIWMTVQDDVPIMSDKIKIILDKN
jgi:uncharacterized protein with HEPN domain